MINIIICILLCEEIKNRRQMTTLKIYRYSRQPCRSLGMTNIFFTKFGFYYKQYNHILTLVLKGNCEFNYNKNMLRNFIFYN